MTTRIAEGAPAGMSVLMVTGAYYPEISGGGLQCRELVRSLRAAVRFAILTTSTDHRLPRLGKADKIRVYRVAVDVRRWRSQVMAALRMTWIVLRLRRQFTILHLHGFSRKAILLTLLAKLSRKKVVLTFHTGGHDAPQAIRAQGRLAWWAYRAADRYTAVSPELHDAHLGAGLSREQLSLVVNGVDLERFRPADEPEQQTLRRELGLPLDARLILFVGFFSQEKCPHLLFEAWSHLQGNGLPASALVFVGATRSQYAEVDPTLAPRLREAASGLGLGARTVFIERARRIERYYRAADLFVLPSSREGLPMALLEAMACGLPCVATRLSGSTDVVIDDGRNGRLVPSQDVRALEEALRWFIEHPAQARALGQQARLTIQARYAIAQTARRYLDVYERLGR